MFVHSFKNPVQDILELKQNFLSQDKRLTPINFDANFVKACAEVNGVSLAKQYLYYLQSTGQKINNAVLNRYISICYRNPADFESSEILRLCQQLKSQSPILDPSTAEALILGLSLTPEWRCCLQLLTEMENGRIVKGTCLNAVVKAALRNSDLKIAFQFMTHVMEVGKKIDEDVYESWLDICHESDTERLIQFWSDHEILPKIQSIRKLQQKLPAPKATTLVTISAEGTCPACKGNLKANRLSETEFTLLRSAFLERVLQGKDVFRGSTPKELEIFRRYIAEHAPFGTVVDGLNVAYVHGRNNNKTAQLVNLVKHYPSKQKLLILGKKHMLKWSAKDMRLVREHALFFATDDLSKDDPFLLYATLYSGPNTYFLSRDLMRDHAFKLEDPSLSRLFRKWQRARQLQITFMDANSINIQKPPLHWPVAQKTADNSWHIPYDNGEDRYSYELPLHWLCARV
nr:EOG090X0CGF [Lepidurus arcticus]